MTRIVGTGLFVVVLVSFLMPWASVSCAGIQAQATGLDFAIGQEVPTLSGTQRGAAEPLATIALVMGVAGAALFFARERGGDIGRFAAGAVGAGALGALKFKAEGQLAQLGAMASGISFSWEIGFWIAMLAFGAAAAVQGWQLVAGDRWSKLGISPRDRYVEHARRPSDGPQARRNYQQAEGYEVGSAVADQAVNQKIRITLRNGEQAGQSFSLLGDSITIGRSTDNTIVLTDPTVSRHHARIFRQGPNYLLEDLGSTAGTRLNHNQVQGPRVLITGSPIRFGDVELSYESDR